MAGKKDRIKDADRFSIVCPDLTKCWVCGSIHQIAKHEIFGGANREKSKFYGLVLPLCYLHHNGSNAGIHYDQQLNARAQVAGQKAWEAQYRDENGGTAEDARRAFIQIFHKNYIMEEETEPKQRSYVY